jgi:cysteine desulfurase
MTPPLYFDHNASTPVHPRVRDAMLRALEEGTGNPGAEHPYGRRSRAIVDGARERVASLLGCAPDEVVFTAGATEADNLAVRSLPPGGRLVTTAIEHPAVLAPAALLEAAGHRVHRLPPGPDGRVPPEAFAAALADTSDTAAPGMMLVSAILAQNETGVIQDVSAIAAAARRAGALVHTDAAQAVGKIPVRVDELGVDLLTVAGHKFYGPKGVGALYVRRGTAVRPVLVGASHERGLRPGTENVPAIAGLGEACALALADLAAEAAREEALRDRLLSRLAAGGFVIHGAGRRLPNTVNGRFPGVRGSALLAAVPEVAFTTGSACHAGTESPSEVLLAMGIPPAEALGAIRLSLGRGTTAADVERAADLLLAAAARLRRG